MICRNLPRSKAALVVINPYKKLLLSCSSDPTTNSEITNREVSRIVSQSDCFDQKAIQIALIKKQELKTG